MEISSATSSLYSVATDRAAQARASQAAQDQKQQTVQTPQAQPAPTQSTSNVQTTQAVSETEKAAAARQEAEQNRPVVNTSGQLVGTRINTTA